MSRLFPFFSHSIGGALSVVYDNLAGAASISIIFFALILFLISVKGRVFFGTDLDRPLLLFVTAALISLFYSVDRNLTLRSLICLLSNISVFYMLLGVLNTKKRIMFFLAFLIGLSLSVSILGLVHYFFIYNLILTEFSSLIPSEVVRNFLQIGRISSVFGWPNLLAGFLMLYVPVAFVFCFFTQNRRERLYVGLIAAILSLTMLFTYSIAGLFSLATAIFISAFLYKRCKNRDGSNKSVGKGKAFIAAIVLLLILVSIIASKRFNIFTLSSFQSRAIYLRSVLMMIKTHPVLGYGLNTFQIVNPNFITSSAGYAAHAHNSYLQIWAETGIVGFISFILFVSAIVKSAIHGLRHCRERKDALVLIGIFCGALAFLIHNIFSFTLFVPRTAIFWWVSLALIFAWIKQMYPVDDKRPVTKNKRLQQLGSALVRLILAISAIFFVRLFLADIYFYNGLNSAKQNNISNSILNFSRANIANPTDGKIHTVMGKTYLNLYNVKRRRVLLKYAEEEFKKAISLRPTVALNYGLLGNLYRVQGKAKIAQNYYDIAARLSPSQAKYRRISHR
ncbi:O-antigen ligase family protein [Candidatus Omnitrophota bacterium]